MTQRITQPKLQRLAQATSALVGAINDARVRYRGCRDIRPRKFTGLTKFLKQLLALPHTSDYRPFERGLKRRLVRANHRLVGHVPKPGAQSYSLRGQLPPVYLDIVQKYEAAAAEMLKTLADVQTTREPLESVRVTQDKLTGARRVVFVPRADAAQYVPTPGSLLISINNPDEELLTPQPGWKGVLFLKLHDVDTPAPGLKVFDEEQARMVLAFISPNIRTVREVVVHCQAGMSRSGGLAIFLSEYLGLPCYKAQTPVDGLRWPLYNRKVYSTMAQVAYGTPGAAFEGQL